MDAEGTARRRRHLRAHCAQPALSEHPLQIHWHCRKSGKPAHCAFMLSQPFISSTNKQPSDEEIVAYLAGLGLEADGRYYYGNEYVSVTDVGTASDNVLKGDNGELYFIDPIIKLKKPAPEVIDFLLSDDLSPKTLARGTQLPWWKALWKRLLH